MSNVYYNELWLVARNDLATLLQLDRRLQNQVVRRPANALNGLLPVYLRYRNLVKRLIICHDQMIQSQKRDLIKRVLDSAVGRMLEYKRQIVNLNYSDYQWPDDFMQVLKYTPDDVDIIVAAIGKEIVQQRTEKIRRMIEEAHAAPVVISQDPSIEEVDPSSSEMPRRRRRAVKGEPSTKTVTTILAESPEKIAAREAKLAAEKEMRDAILLIQSHERARVDRWTGGEVRRMHAYGKKCDLGIVVPRKLPKDVLTRAAATIQNAWKTYLTRKWLRKRMALAEELLDMTPPRWKPRETLERDKENFQKKLSLIPPFAEKVNNVTEKERARLLIVRGPGLMDDITEEIREWFVIWYNETGQFSTLPAADLGGSVLIATGQTITPQEFLVQKTTTIEEEPEKSKGKQKKQRKPAIPTTQAFTLLEDANKEFVDEWIFRNGSDNYREGIYDDIISDKLCHQLQLEARQIVDELMRLELKKLNAALKKDAKADGKKIDVPGDRRQRRQRRGGKRGKKDIFQGVPLEDTFKELAASNIIRDYDATSLKDWTGDLSYQNYEADREMRNYRHRLGEIRQVAMEYCILPLSSKEIHRIAPLIRSVCICGFPRHGKSFLVNAVCTELGAVLIDMSPEVMVDKYVGKKAQKTLLQKINRVARGFAPSVIFVDNAERAWMKTVPPEERHLNPKRFAKQFPKLVKSIKRGDQVLFLTTTSEPYKAKKRFIKVHDKFIMIPLTDYNTLYMFYKDLFAKYHSVDRDIDVSCIARMTVGIPLEFIRNAVESVLSVSRRITLKTKPLREHEVIEAVLKYQAPPPKTFAQMEKFTARTPLAKKRARYLQGRETKLKKK